MNSLSAVLDDYSAIPFDRTSISRERLDVGLGRRLNGLPWRGQFTPDLVKELLDAYAQPGPVIDPFCGSGTALIEASRKGLPSSGIEVNPAAVILARLHTLVSDQPGERCRVVGEAHSILEKASGSTTNVMGKLVQLLPDPKVRIVAQAMFLLALGNSANLGGNDLERSRAKISTLVSNQPDEGGEIRVELGDARTLGMADQSVATTITSPPYVNVFNYHQNYRAAVELLGWEVLPAARAEFGSNRKHRQNRFLTVIQYAQDLGLALAEINRVTCRDGLSIWVIGRESSVLGESITNPAILHAMAVGACGVKLIGKHERSFTSRFGTLVYEDVLVYSHGHESTERHNDESIIEYGRHIGTAVLEGISRGRSGVRWEISAAIDSAQRVMPSPMPEFRDSSYWHADAVSPRRR